MPKGNFLTAYVPSEFPDIGTLAGLSLHALPRAPPSLHWTLYSSAPDGLVSSLSDEGCVWRQRAVAPLDRRQQDARVLTSAWRHI